MEGKKKETDSYTQGAADKRDKRRDLTNMREHESWLRGGRRERNDIVGRKNRGKGEEGGRAGR